MEVMLGFDSFFISDFSLDPKSKLDALVMFGRSLLVYVSLIVLSLASVVLKFMRNVINRMASSAAMGLV